MRLGLTLNLRPFLAHYESAFEAVYGSRDMKIILTLGKSDFEDIFHVHHIKIINPYNYIYNAVGDPKSDLKGGQFGRPFDLQKLFARSFCPLC